MGWFATQLSSSSLRAGRITSLLLGAQDQLNGIEAATGAVRPMVLTAYLYVKVLQCILAVTLFCCITRQVPPHKTGLGARHLFLPAVGKGSFPW